MLRQFDHVKALQSWPSEPAKGSAVLEGLVGVIVKVRDDCVFDHGPVCYTVHFSDGTERRHLDDDGLELVHPLPAEDDAPLGCYVICLIVGAALMFGALALIAWLRDSSVF